MYGSNNKKSSDISKDPLTREAIPSAPKMFIIFDPIILPKAMLDFFLIIEKFFLVEVKLLASIYS